jgi:hypothetical protein
LLFRIQILKYKTKEAIDSDEWLKISPVIMLEFLKMEFLSISETDLVRALIRWGKYQLQQQNPPEETLRDKILPGIREINFRSMHPNGFAKLCTEEFGELLSEDEKSSIVHAFITDNWLMVPTDIVPSKRAPRRGPYTFCPLPYEPDPIDTTFCNKEDCRQFSLKFQLSKKAASIAGVEFSNGTGHDSIIRIEILELRRDKWVTIGSGFPRLYIWDEDESRFCFMFGSQKLAGLDADREYKLTFFFNASLGESIRRYTLPKDKIPSISNHGLSLMVNEEYLTFGVHVQGIMFMYERSP